MTLSILIPTLPERARSCLRLVRLLSEQALEKPVEILTDATVGAPTGTKRNRLLERATGEYVCFVDDDDLVADDYVDRVLAGCREQKDCCSLEGLVVHDRRPAKPFHHSIAFSKWAEDATQFVRSPNHLNAVRRTLALQARFPDVTIGEDREYSRRLYPLLKSQADIPGCLYWYFAETLVRARATSLRFLLKWPTRGRPELFKQTLRAHMDALSGQHPTRLSVSSDEDDPTAADVRQALFGRLTMTGSRFPTILTELGRPGRGKIAAINADIPTDDWDVLVLLADDMVPVESGWDDRIVVDMARTFPHLDGVLAYDDGFRHPPRDPEEVTCITMPVMGRRYYDRFGYIYHPEYSSLWCDVELADVARASGRTKRIPRVIIRHDWMGRRPDPLLLHNESFFEADKRVYERRRTAGFPKGRSDVYTQNDEEDVIVREVGAQPGRLLDIGAHDGKTLSNSLRLIELGWTGVLIEPAPGPFAELLKRHGGNPNLTLLNCAVSDKAGFATFHESGGDMVGTLSEPHARRWSAAGVQWRPYGLWTVSVRDLFAYIGSDFQFVTIDVEGTNLEVFRAVPWGRLTRTGAGLRMVCVEHDGHVDEMTAEMALHGFVVAAQNGENVLFRLAH